MIDKKFVHLHLHTHYSFLDSSIRLGELMSYVKDTLGMDAVAMTDHGNLFGVIDFQEQAQRKKVKSIIGIDAYMTPDHRNVESKETYHLTLLAKNLTGYRNLLYLSSISWINGLYSDRFETLPRIDFEFLSAYNEGLICLSGDLGSEVSQLILRNRLSEAEEVVSRYAEAFPKDHYYLELTRTPLAEYQKVCDALIDIGERLGIPLVATNDCHYLRQEDALPHAVLMKVQLDQTININKALDHGLTTLYVKSAEEMYKLFEDVPSACENTVKIAEMCDLVVPTGKPFLPIFNVPEDFPSSPDELPESEPRDVANNETEEAYKNRLRGNRIANYFSYVAREGLKERLQAFDKQGLSYDPKPYWDRLELEIGVIRKMDFPGYFLIVGDFIAWSKSQGIPVGPGRGSGAGSLVAYSMKITDIDPLKYALLFERFLNPERKSMPDFDVDFCTRRRGEVIDYVKEKYGRFNVAQIAAFTQLKPKGAIKDVSRALGIPPSRANSYSKLVPDKPIDINFEAVVQEPRVIELRKTNQEANLVFELAIKLENLSRQATVHAAGIVISEGPLWGFVPVFKGKDNELISQFAKHEVEEAGLVKFDFLALNTLTIIQDALAFVNRRLEKEGKDPLDISTIAIDDPKVFELIGNGNTVGVFQLESEGFKNMMIRLCPENLEDIIAAVALYRPGPIKGGMVDNFILCKKGKKEPEYYHPLVIDILKPTYGNIVYQEQVMQIAQALAGYSLGEADLLRRAMGKKNEEQMKKEMGRFVDGAVKNGLTVEHASAIFQKIEYFAGYGFNKSHSAAYALLTYQTAWLKTFYPVEFMASLMANALSNTDRIVSFISEATRMGLEVLPPDVNESELNFSVANGKIRFGLAAIKGVGEDVIAAVVSSRKKGAFTSIYDFCNKVPSKEVNKRVLESLIYSGAFDSIAPEQGRNKSVLSIARNRAMMLEVIPTALKRGERSQHDQAVGQMTLFDLLKTESKSGENSAQDYYPNNVSMTEEELLRNEKAFLGYYVVGHPLKRFVPCFNVLGVTPISAILSGAFQNKQVVRVAGAVDSFQERFFDRKEKEEDKNSKRGKKKDSRNKSSDAKKDESKKIRMGRMVLEDLSGAISLVGFDKALDQLEKHLEKRLPLYIEASVNVRENRGDEEAQVSYELNLMPKKEVMLLVDACKARLRSITLYLMEEHCSSSNLLKLYDLIGKNKDPEGILVCLSVVRKEEDAETTILIPLARDEYRVAYSNEFMGDLEEIFEGIAVECS